MAGASLGGEAAEALTSTRSAAFAAGMQGVSNNSSGVLGFDNDLPVIGPSKAAIDDVDGMAKRTPNPNTVLR
jgi:hypothetical protein